MSDLFTPPSFRDILFEYFELYFKDEILLSRIYERGG